MSAKERFPNTSDPSLHAPRACRVHVPSVMQHGVPKPRDASSCRTFRKTSWPLAQTPNDLRGLRPEPAECSARLTNGGCNRSIIRSPSATRHKKQRPKPTGTCVCVQLCIGERVRHYLESTAHHIRTPSSEFRMCVFRTSQDSLSSKTSVVHAFNLRARAAR
jgi:hypothetical protein